MSENVDNKDTIKKTKSKFLRDKKNILILILIALLVIFVVLFCRSAINQAEIIDLQSQVQTLSDSNNKLSLKVENSENKITELENDRNEIKRKSETLQSKKDSLETEIQQLKETNDTLRSQISTLKKNSNSTKRTSTSTSTSLSVVGVWTSSVTDTEFSIEDHASVRKTFSTKYEFKNNGDFYVNNTKVGSYKDGSIFFKDSNDTNYRNALYKFSGNNLYVNLYQNSTDICVSTDFFKCIKN